MVNGKMIMVIWHVDDLKISHKVKKVVDDFIRQLESEFSKEVPLSKSWGKVHDYLGMTLDFSKPGEVTMTMIDYIKAMITDLPEDMIGLAATLAANHLFNTNETNPSVLSNDQAETYIHCVMQLLYLSQHAHPDIQTAVSFLCT